MHVLPQDVKINEKALDYASTFFPIQECLRQYMAVLLSYPLPGKLLDEVTQSHNVTMEDAHAVIRDCIQAVFLRPEP